MTTTWTCPCCHTTDVSLRYASGKMKKCKDCQRFVNVTTNAKKVRKHGRQPLLTFTEKEFLAWVQARPRQCHFCSISEPQLEALGLKSSIGLTVAALGIDRLDNNGDYALNNIALCCYGCNKAKGNVFTTEEMLVIGPAVARAWAMRAASTPPVATPSSTVVAPTILAAALYQEDAQAQDLFDCCDTVVAVLSPEQTAEWLAQFKVLANEEDAADYCEMGTLTAVVQAGDTPLTMVCDSGGEIATEAFSAWCEERRIPHQFMVDSPNVTGVALEDINTGMAKDDPVLVALLHRAFNPDGDGATAQ